MTRSRLQPGWRPERAVPIADALEDVLDDLERLCTREAAELPADPVAIGTGVDALDRVCGGGIHIGEVTLIEADLASQADALILAVARRIDQPVLLATTSTREATSWLIAGEADVPSVFIRSGELSEADWKLISHAIGGLAVRDLALTEAGSLRGLTHLAGACAAPVLLVADLERLGPAANTIAALGHLAASAGIAIVATAGPLGDLPNWSMERVVRLVVVAHDLGSRATIISAGGPDALSAAEVTVSGLVGDVG